MWSRCRLARLFLRHGNQIKAFTKLMVQMVADQRASEVELKDLDRSLFTGEKPYFGYDRKGPYWRRG